MASPAPRTPCSTHNHSLTGDQLARRAVPPSSLSLAGVVRHLTEVEAHWLRTELLGEGVADRWSTKGDPDGPVAGRHLGHMDLLREAVDGRTGY
ncbi:mycothiol transferase [Janibacter limosus]|uniref:mycothiol transferase n=1 Tax=Janibacter limosus TaxID=53458 RepID=UPI000A050AAB|nr:DUF664 domain-containing protein [Janibacter limosus]